MSLILECNDLRIVSYKIIYHFVIVFSLRLGTESTSVEQPIQARNSAELSKSQAGLMGERNRQFPCLFPINPHMQHYESRVATFDHNWRRFNIKASINDIARAGFYFLG